MGMSIHPQYGKVTEIQEYVFKHQMDYGTINRTDDEPELEEFINKVLAQFGAVTPDGTWFIISYNEYYSDSGYNAGWEILDFLNRYFGIDADENYCDIFDLPLTSMWESGANAGEVAEELGVELEEFDTDEGYL